MTQQINLYNPALRAKRDFITGLTLLLGMAVIVLGIALVYAYYEWQVSRLMQEAAIVEADLKQRQSEAARLSEEVAGRKRSKDVEARLVRAEALLKGREEIRDALSSGALGAPEGFSELMRAFARQAVPGVWLTGLNIGAGGGEISIEGRTANPELIPGYIQRLNQEQAMRGRSFAALHIQQPAEAASLQESNAPKDVAAGAKPVAERTAAPRYHEFVLGSIDGGLAGGETASRFAANGSKK